MYSVSELYGQAARFGGVQYAVVDAYRDGVAIATDLAVTSGSVTDDSSGGVRRKLDLELFPELGLWDLLAPIGTELRPRSIVRYPSGATEVVPMGVFDVDGQSMSYGDGGTIKMSGSDNWVKIQRSRFLRPYASTPGLLVVEQIAKMIRDVFGPGQAVTITATSDATMGSVVWDRDRDKAIEELAKSIGAYVSFDRNGVPTIADLPTAGPAAVWTVDASETGVMLSAQRARDRKRAYNVVVAASDKADGEAPFAPVAVWDNDPTSVTFAGIDPIVSPEGAGPFGIVPYFFTSPLLTDEAQANEAARTILAKVTGLSATLSLSAIRNHALDSLDVIDVLLPPERYRPVVTGYVGGSGFGTAPFGTAPFGEGSGGRPIVEYVNDNAVERHIIDRVTHPLLPTSAQSIDTRSTRTDDFS